MSSDNISISEELLLRVREALGPDVSIETLQRRGNIEYSGGPGEDVFDTGEADGSISVSDAELNTAATTITQEEDETGDFLFTARLHGGHRIQLSTAEDDFNKEKKTLFATHIWNGSTVLANYIIDHVGIDTVATASVVELGAGAGLPSMLFARLGSRLVCCSDYPSPTVMENLDRNIGRNGLDRARIQAVPYIWGEDAGPVLATNADRPFDILVASECLWRHEQHRVLADSISRLLRKGGLAIVSYSHHVPGLEAEDDAFFDVAEREFGLRVVRREAVLNKHMWQKHMDVDIYVVELTKL